MRTKAKITKNPERRELIVERLVAIPRRLAWQGWTQLEHVERWWGPRSWTATIFEMDVRPGGKWRYSLAPDDGIGEQARCLATYNEVIEPLKLVYTDTFADEDWNVIEGSDMLTTVDFEEMQSGTKLTITTHFASVEDLGAAETMGMIEGYEDTLERFVEYLSEQLN